MRKMEHMKTKFCKSEKLILAAKLKVMFTRTLRECYNIFKKPKQFHKHIFTPL